MDKPSDRDPSSPEETYIIADEQASARAAAGPADETPLTENIPTPALQTPDEERDEAEGGWGFQIIDLAEEEEEDDKEEDNFDDELDDELGDEEDDDELDDEDEDDEFNDDEATNSDYHAVSPVLTSGDVDADWKRAEVTGEETPGGTVSTPDQDVVEEIGQATGVVYNDEEPLDFAEKMGKRDRERWELDPASIDPDAPEPGAETTKPKNRRKAKVSRTRS